MYLRLARSRLCGARVLIPSLVKISVLWMSRFDVNDRIAILNLLNWTLICPRPLALRATLLFSPGIEGSQPAAFGPKGQRAGAASFGERAPGGRRGQPSTGRTGSQLSMLDDCGRFRMQRECRGGGNSVKLRAARQ